MLPISDLLSPEPSTKISLEIPVEQAIDQMADAIAKIMQECGWEPHQPSCKHYAVVSGLSGSCRLISNQRFDESVPFPCGLTPMGLAMDFMTEFCQEARFPPEPQAEGKAWGRCFEVFKIIFDKHPAVLVRAGWMEAP